MYAQKLSNVQLEILKLYSTDLSISELLKFKQELSNFFAKKAIQEADQVWEKKGLTNNCMDIWLNEENI
ncbi:MAG: hypothetical protein HQK75_10590 [Candidatus Magnetomorum sp.]|nr:hypothetical protein [Candidatus Magnetomorum sp.]